MGIYIKEQKGYASQIGHLVSQMDYARKTTLDSIEGCTQEELDGLLSSGGNTIGALLLHMAAVEKGFQIEFFDGRQPNEDEWKEWGAAYELGTRGRKEIVGHPLSFYIETLRLVRERTLAVLADKSDEWLYEECRWDGHPSNHYFIWFHVMEDEINHRGQIRLMRKALQQERKREA
ncbi:hypothetical protein ASG66_04275 [Bacillus sp. Leaf406]|nr:hypothetical protein ASG66_04275 [Bacillus sp. Leaf406]